MKAVRLPMDDPRWVDLTSTHPDAGPFHLPAWATLIADCYRFDTFALVACDSSGEVLGGLPVVSVGRPLGQERWVSLPFTDYCPLLARPEADVEEVVDVLRRHVLGGPAAELAVRDRLPVLENVFPDEVGWRHVLAVPRDVADLRPHANHRNSRNRAQRSGIHVVRGTAREDVAAFYRLHTLTRRRQGVPVQPRRFFELLWERMVTQGHGFVLSARLDGEVLASAVYLQHNGTLVDKYTASDPMLRQTQAGHLLKWEAMVLACEEGVRVFDDGRTDPEADGLRAFKSAWGLTEVPLVYTHIAGAAPQHHRLRVGETPKRIIRTSPVWVCRALGEGLYRWTA